MAFSTPLPLLKLKSQMVLKQLSLIEVSKSSGVSYTVCSQILNGRLNDPERLAAIRRAIRDAKPPELAAA